MPDRAQDAVGEAPELLAALIVCSFVVHKRYLCDSLFALSTARIERDHANIRTAAQRVSR